MKRKEKIQFQRVVDAVNRCLPPHVRAEFEAQLERESTLEGKLDWLATTMEAYICRA